MATGKSLVSTAKAREAASVIQWHPGFCCAVKFELRENRDVLEFNTEVDAVLQVSVSANTELYEQIRRDDRMCQALRELMKDELDQAERQGRREGTISGAVTIYRDEMGMDDQTIISRIISRFNLTLEQARNYVVPQGM